MQNNQLERCFSQRDQTGNDDNTISSPVTYREIQRFSSKGLSSVSSDLPSDAKSFFHMRSKNRRCVSFMMMTGIEFLNIWHIPVKLCKEFLWTYCFFLLVWWCVSNIMHGVWKVGCHRYQVDIYISLLSPTTPYIETLDCNFDRHNRRNIGYQIRKHTTK